MQKADFYSDGIFKLVPRISVIREYFEKQWYFRAIMKHAYTVMTSQLSWPREPFWLNLCHICYKLYPSQPLSHNITVSVDISRKFSIPLLMPCHTHPLLVRVDCGHCTMQHCSHIDQLVADLLAGHALQRRALWLVLPLWLRQIHAKMDALGFMVNTYL